MMLRSLVVMACNNPADDVRQERLLCYVMPVISRQILWQVRPCFC